MLGHDFSLKVEFLNAGINYQEDKLVWDVGTLHYSHIDVQKKIVELNRDSLMSGTPDYICALGRSALAPSVLVAFSLQVPLLWFSSASLRSLHPRYYRIEGKSILMVDTIAVTGKTLVRHAMLLKASHANLLKPWVLIDCDTFRLAGSQEQRLLEETCGGIRSFINLSWLMELGQNVLPFLPDSRIPQILNSDVFKEVSFWKPKPSKDEVK